MPFTFYPTRLTVLFFLPISKSLRLNVERGYILTPPLPKSFSMVGESIFKYILTSMENTSPQ